MDKTLVVGVNYNSDEAALQFISSIKNISSANEVSTSVILVDNTERESSNFFSERINAISSEIGYIQAPSNLGYFGGARLGLERYLETHSLPDWVVVANVDLEFRDQVFFTGLEELSEVENLGVVAPTIWSERRESDWNPKLRARPLKVQMFLYKLLYSSYLLYNFYLLLFFMKSYVSRRLKHSQDNSKSHYGTTLVKKQIYAPHGACIIFSKSFFQRGGTLDYPIFLYGEEFFVAETARSLGLHVVYAPNLVVYSHDHISTGGFPRSREMVSHHYESIVFIWNKYFS